MSELGGAADAIRRERLAKEEAEALAVKEQSRLLAANARRIAAARTEFLARMNAAGNPGMYTPTARRVERFTEGSGRRKRTVERTVDVPVDRPTWKMDNPLGGFRGSRPGEVWSVRLVPNGQWLVTRHTSTEEWEPSIPTMQLLGSDVLLAPHADALIAAMARLLADSDA